MIELVGLIAIWSLLEYAGSNIVDPVNVKSVLPSGDAINPVKMTSMHAAVPGRGCVSDMKRRPLEVLICAGSPMKGTEADMTRPDTPFLAVPEGKYWH